MTDEKVVPLHARQASQDKRETATCTGSVPSRPVRLQGLRKPTGLPAEDALEMLGLGKGVPHCSKSVRVDVKALWEIRARMTSLAEAAGQMEIASRLIRTEAETLERWLSEIIGDDTTPPEGAA